MPNPQQWTIHKNNGSIPTPRSGHTITTVGKYNILFGGIDNCNKKDGKLFPNNQIYTITMKQNNVCDWRLINCSGDQPMPRAHHAACAIGPDKLFIFGGYYSTSQRFNDVFILRTTDFKWAHPPNQKTILGEPKNSESKIGAPDPRANHSCTYYKGKVYVFGGHGGAAFKRTAFNDLHYFDCESSEWTKIEEIGGVNPQPRGGHSSALWEEKERIIIFGGWSNSTQFSDVYMYDINQNIWIDAEICHDIPRWYHSGIMVKAIPSCKFFVFGGSIGSFEEGGNRTLSKITDDAFVLDMESLKWSNINLDDPLKPKIRESTSMFYDQSESRLVIFGGWTNQWLNDTYSLSVALITGPPYAIYSIDPKLGPVTGKTKVKIKGDGFKDSSQIIIRFESIGKGTQEVNGIFINEQEIQCETPSFEQFGPREVIVTCSINKGDYTITSTKFTFFLNTKASSTIAFGPGLLHENLINEMTIFCIQARNSLGKNRISGRDIYEIKICKPQSQKQLENFKEQKRQALIEQEIQSPGKQKKGGKEEEKKKKEEKEEIQIQEIVLTQEEILFGGEKLNFEIIDNDDGTYYVKYLSNEVCDGINISIKFLNEFDEFEPIRGSPYFSSFKSGVTIKNNEMVGPVVIGYVQNSINDLDKFIKDTKDNINVRNKNIDDIMELLFVKENLEQIYIRKDGIELNIDIVEQCISYLSKNDMAKESDSKKLLKIKDEWSQLNKMSQSVEKDISAPMRTEAEKSKENIVKFEQKLKDYFTTMKKERQFYIYKNGYEASMQELNEVDKEIQDFQKNLKQFKYFCKMFQLGEILQNSIKQLDTIDQEIITLKKLWQHIQKCQIVFDNYLGKCFIETETAELEEEMKQLRKGLLDQKGVDRKSNTYQGIFQDIKDWLTFLPLLSELKDPAMNVEDGRHWKKVMKLVKKDFLVDANLKLQLIWNLKLYEQKDNIEEITDQAKQEKKISVNLEKIIQQWNQIEFELIPHKNTDILTLRMIEENFDMLEEHQLNVNNMLLNKFIGYYEGAAEKWKQDLGIVFDVITLLIEVQKSWSFLENLFIHSDEVKKELPDEAKQFIIIDQNTKEIMSKGCQIKNILSFCTQAGILQQLEELMKQLKVCEKALNEFLDGKRRAFPRFYFVSVADLLDILSNGNNPKKINRHMPKIYQAIGELILQDDGERPLAKAMKCGVGVEADVHFTTPLKLQGKVEVYLNEIIEIMRSTLKTIAISSFKNFSTNEKTTWLKNDPAQITLLINNINFSKDIEECFHKIAGGDLDSLKNELAKMISNITTLIKLVQGDLNKSERQKIMCLITIDTHGRDLIDNLQKENVRKADEFQWQSQLKFYWNQEINDAQIRIADASFIYSYEYLGNGPRLVVTPLTDRIYVTATQALHLKMGCAPAGPAGTGKTETTKDLSAALAKACYVFNCSGEMNYESMGNIFKGLASSGCWGCFDEFNRLVPEVLSVCSVQFKAVTDAIKYKKQRFVLEGDEISIDNTCGVFITMNPGYLGRSELPEGLKALFRPITVVVPDIQLICENMLMAEGFVQGKMLSIKFITLYLLCKDLLSKALHYDWGLRAIKSVLVVAGSFKRAEQDVSEDALLMRALRDFNVPKIIAADIDIFFGLLGDLFPGINILRKRDMNFEKNIEDVCKEHKLTSHPEFILKVVQLKELLEIRHCVFILGPPGSAKTKTWQILAKSEEKAGIKQHYVDLNPKVVHTKDFYGYNLPSKEWKDGLMSKLMRNYAEMPDQNPKWILLDGDLDANWIESMNSVMDDNKILTLANNERIPLKAHMRLIFEIRDLKFASPATVSRAGILYISDDSGFQWKSYVNSWIKQQFPQGMSKENDEKTSQIEKLFERYVEKTIQHIKKSFKQVVPISPISQVISLCKCLEMLLKEDVTNIEFLFVFAIVWCLGGSLTEKDGIDYRKEFSNWWKSEWKTVCKFPMKGTVFDYYVETQDGLKFVEWSHKVIPIDFNPQQGHVMSSITVMTRESIATASFIKNFIFVNHPSLLIGNSGCGKTQLLKGILNEIVAKMPDNYNYQAINFNYFTDAEYLQNMLESVLEKKGGKQFGPKGKVRLIYFIDDLNMPMLDPYNTQTAIALLRQHIDYNHWYDIAKLTVKDIINTQHLAAMNPTAGSFYVNPRYQRHFWTCAVPFPDNESLFTIYNTFLSGHLRYFKPSVQEYSAHIIKAALQLHFIVSEKFKKTAINFHYEFNIRHIANIFSGILQGKAEQFCEPDKLIRLWIHESERTYADRLVTKDHIELYKTQMFDLCKKNFPKFTFTKYFQKEGAEPLLFCDFVTSLQADRFYDQMPADKLEIQVSEALKEYNENNAFMDLVLFEDALRHILKITRIIAQPCGHALLVGVGGSGKQSLSKLAASIMQFTLFTITISSTYNINDLKVDLQNLFFKTGIKDEGYLFLFTEGQITRERFLVYINDLLSSGEIAELYTLDEKEGIINQIRGKVKAEGKSDSRDNCWNWFIEKVRKNLHMALCFSPVGDIRKRSRQFPALINCTVIDWFQPWPYEALFSVANNFLSQIDLGCEEVHKMIVKFMPYSFDLVNKISLKMLELEKRKIYTTPKSFLELISLYKSMLDKKKKTIEINIERYENGLLKLQATAEQVAIIQEEVKVKQIEAEAKKKEADEFAQTVGIEKTKVEKENAKANAEAEKCSVIKADVEAKKKSTQEDLEAAIPLVQEAIAALDSITKKDFQTAKAYATPPQGVPEVFAAAMYLMGGHFNEVIEVDAKKKPKKVDWGTAKKMMANPEDFLKRLTDFKDIVDANQVIPSNVLIVKSQYLNQEYFKYDIIKNKSNAAAGICLWVINIVKYWDVIQIVEPKRKALAEATIQLQEATIKLEQVEAEVKVLNDALNKLQSEYAKAIKEKEDAIATAARYERRLNLAQRLVTALGSENERWANSIVQLKEDMVVLTGDVLISSAFISYAGPFNKKFRDIIMKDNFIKFILDGKIPVSPSVNPVKLLTDEAQIAVWNKQGLPTDPVSVENGTILSNSERYPLMIDPQNQGNYWIKEREKEHQLRNCRLGSNTINRDIEFAIENGISILIENMGERIDAILMPVISRQYIKRGRNKIMKFGGKDLMLSNDFKLFLHTKLSNPHYPPEIQAETTMINFTVTEEGLSDQLLYLVVKMERPDLAKKRNELIQQQNDFKIKLKELEDGILYQLANAQGDILDNIELIENLEDSKKISVEVSEKVEIAQKTEIKINEASEFYRPAASRGALFYFLLTDLAKIHSFYKYSLESFIIVIERAINLISLKKDDQEEIKQELLQSELPQQFQKQSQQQENESEIKNQSQQQKEMQEQTEQQKQISNSQDQLKVEEEIIENSNLQMKEDQLQDQEDAQSKKIEEGTGTQFQGTETIEKQEDGTLEKSIQEKEQQIQNIKQQDDTLEDPLTPRSLKKRVEKLIDTITYTAFANTRRGLFERHKIIVTAMLCFRTMLKSKLLEIEEVNHLFLGRMESTPGTLPDVLKSFISDQVWASCRALEQIKIFSNFCSSLEIDSLQWKKWYNEEKAEFADLPKSYKDLSKFHRLLLIRAMRPDRLSSALYNFCQEQLGTQFVEQEPFDIFATFQETSPTTPIFFVLFPGVDPTPEVEKVGQSFDISISNGKFINISMGQGQENKARDALFKAGKEGNWVMLQNVHLMQSWMQGIKGLEGFLEQIYINPHQNFRCFISSEPPPLQDLEIIPESILQSSLKIANEQSQDIKANLRRAYAHFNQEFIDKFKKPNEGKAILFGLCWFHSLVVGRKKFGSLGWSRNYSFNDGDLTICADVLQNYLSSYEQIPYDDIRYIYGEIMYGGHITDNWDRRTNATYLKVIIKPELLQNCNLAHLFKSPDPNKFDYEAYKNYIETKLPIESPGMFGLHANAEIGYLTQQCEMIMNTILDIQGGGSGASGSASDASILVFIQEYQKKTPPEFNYLDLQSRVKDLTPFIIVCLQEVDRMNVLLKVIQTSLEELKLGLTGALNMTDSMEFLSKSIQLNRVPSNWEQVAYFSKKNMAAWFQDLIERNIQLQEWTSSLECPISLCISFLFNPMSFLTACMQFTARKNNLPLDDMALQTNITQFKGSEEVQDYSKDGMYVHGLFLEGAAWEIGGQGQQGYLIDQKIKELHPKLPVINVVSVPLKEKKIIGQYECPVYVTSQRGQTYVFTANLNMESEDSDEKKWILAGVCLLMSDD